MKKVLIPIAMGFEEIEALTLVDVLRRANVKVKTAGLDSDVLVGAHGVKVEADMLLEDIKSDDFDMIVLPGGLPGAQHLAQSDKILSLLKEFDKKDKYIGAICAAPWALGEAGVLKDSYTCYPSFEETVNKDGYNPNEDVVIDRNILTSRGPATAMTFALEIVKKLCGEDTHKEVKAGLLA